MANEDVIENLLGGVYGNANKEHKHRMTTIKLSQRIETLEKSVCQHRKALNKANEVLKECIKRITELEALEKHHLARIRKLENQNNVIG